MSVTTTRRRGVIGGLIAASALLAACSAAPAAEPDGSPDRSTVTIVDNHGEIEVPVNPERLVALDNTAFQTLSDWDISLVAAPKPVMGDLWPEFTGDDVLDVGLHREPNLEAIVEADPDLVIGGYRFSSYHDDIVALAPVVIETNARDGEEHISELKRQVTILGQIFEREDDAQALADALDAAVADAKDAYNGTDTVIGLITSGGSIAYAAPGEGRGVGSLFPTLGLTPGIEQAAEDTSHGDDIALEAIAQANPDWLIVLDRDGAFNEEGYVPAKDLIENAEALQDVTAVQQGQVVYLPPTFYLDEGIQVYTALYRSIAEAFAAAG